MSAADAPAEHAPDWLIGHWRLLHAEAALGFTPGTRMEFRPDGSLRYAIPIEDTVQVIALLYRVEGTILRTENPSAPHSTATLIRRGPGDTMVMDFVASLAVFIREGPIEPRRG